MPDIIRFVTVSVEPPIESDKVAGNGSDRARVDAPSATHPLALPACESPVFYGARSMDQTLLNERSMKLSLASCALIIVACSGTSEFAPLTDALTVDQSDPPTNPDPLDVESSGGVCAKHSLLSPAGLTFVIHVSRDYVDAKRELGHLEDLRKYIRERDVFMIEHGSPIVQDLRGVFPCNRFETIAYPDKMSAALATGDGIDGIVIDWELGVDAHDLAWNEQHLHDWAHAIHAQGKVAGFAPAWRFHSSDAEAELVSNMNFELAQIQGSCVASAKAFGNYAHSIASDYHDRGAGARNVAFEISLDSHDVASNHVDADRAAACTRDAYGKGARAIYIYGNGHDQLPSYFHNLDAMNIRSPR